MLKESHFFVKIILSGYRVKVDSVKFCAIRFALNCEGHTQYRYFRFISPTDHDKRVTEDGSSITAEGGLHSWSRIVWQKISHNGLAALKNNFNSTNGRGTKTLLVINRITSLQISVGSYWDLASTYIFTQRLQRTSKITNR